MTVPDSILQEWISWIQDLQKLENYKVDRYFKPANFGTAASAQLHHLLMHARMVMGLLVTCYCTTSMAKHIVDL